MTFTTWLSKIYCLRNVFLYIYIYNFIIEKFTKVEGNLETIDLEIITIITWHGMSFDFFPTLLTSWSKLENPQQY